jgi:hypothetical protein
VLLCSQNEELIQFFCSPEALEGNPELEPDAKSGKPAVEGVRIVRDSATALGKGFAFVLFRSQVCEQHSYIHPVSSDSCWSLV